MGDTKCPVEKLLVERAVTCWAQLHAVDIEIAASMHAVPARLNCMIGWQDKAGRRYDAALARLVQYRKERAEAEKTAKPESPGVRVFRVNKAGAAMESKTGTG